MRRKFINPFLRITIRWGFYGTRQYISISMMEGIFTLSYCNGNGLNKNWIKTNQNNKCLLHDIAWSIWDRMNQVWLLILFSFTIKRFINNIKILYIRPCGWERERITSKSEWNQSNYMLHLIHNIFL